MKIMCLGDLHLTEKTPENRIDDYPGTQYSKMEWILKLAKKEGCSAILQPGDFFNKHTSPNFLIRKYIKLFKRYNVPIYATIGQHDIIHHHSDIENTPSGILDASDVTTLVATPVKIENVTILSAGWEQPIPEIEDPDSINILITHRMIINEKKVWHAQETYEKSHQLLRTTNFDLIVSGDNHARFTDTLKSKDGNRHLVNCGSLMRGRIDQADHKPAVYIYDTGTKELEKHLIRIKKIEYVLDITKATEEKEKNEELESFLENLNTTVEIPGLEFTLNMIAYLKENDFETDVVDTVNEFLA